MKHDLTPRTALTSIKYMHMYFVKATLHRQNTNLSIGGGEERGLGERGLGRGDGGEGIVGKGLQESTCELLNALRKSLHKK